MFKTCLLFAFLHWKSGVFHFNVNLYRLLWIPIKTGL